MNWTIGADIEVMLEKNGGLVSAIPHLPQNEKGLKIPHGIVFHDNVLAEFTVTPSKTEADFIKHILENLSAVRKMFTSKGINLRIASSAHYSDKELDNPIAKRFGCSPDFDAYRMCVNEVASSATETTLRTAGGHIHFSHAIFDDPFKIIEMIKLMDLFLGVPSILMDNTPEAKERRSLYGKAGAHRPKDYPGGEYRPLSNFWTQNADSIRWAYKQTEKCLALLLDGKTVSSLGFDENMICKVINSADVAMATAIMEKCK